jgi:hypothetical protein
MVVTSPNVINGFSTCLAPNDINIKKLLINVKKNILFNGLNCIPLNLEKSTNHKINNIKIAKNIAITPNNLLGIDLKIA